MQVSVPIHIGEFYSHPYLRFGKLVPDSYIWNNKKKRLILGLNTGSHIRFILHIFLTYIWLCNLPGLIYCLMELIIFPTTSLGLDRGSTFYFRSVLHTNEKTIRTITHSIVTWHLKYTIVWKKKRSMGGRNALLSTLHNTAGCKGNGQ